MGNRPGSLVLTLVPSRRFRHLLTHKYTVASPHEVAAAYGCPSNSVRERPLHDCLCVHARRRQPPTIGEYRPIFCASRRKRRGRKRQSLRRSSFTAFCRLSRRFALLPARTIPVAGRSIRRRVARWTTPSPRSRNAATCHCPRTRSRRFPTSPALVRTDRTTERVIRGQHRASWRGVACSLVVLSLSTWPPAFVLPPTSHCVAFACRPLRSLSTSRL